ncbi:MAG: hypothetical protein VR64_03895 [Desulfatitalea sp. BRH_c12]|nr:MAG: hypothetical protein VR64_03895 [Desulfatitalea sp. BRH_c12]
MLSLGAPPSETREMDINDIFIARTKLMIIMAKAYLDGFPLGDLQRRAMLENALHLETDCITVLADLISGPDRFVYKRIGESEFDHKFYWKANLLAVMIKAVGQGYTLKKYQRGEMQDYIDHTCKTLMFRPGDWYFLQVP